jgi:hypothetical protein
MSQNQSILVEIGPGLSVMTGLPRIGSWKTGERPKKASRGVFGFNTQTNALEYFDGSHWMSAPLSKK